MTDLPSPISRSASWRQAARIGETARDLFIARQLRVVLWGGYRDPQERFFQRGLPDHIDMDGVGCFAQRIEIAGNLLPIRKPVIVADAKPEVVLGRFDLG